MATKKRQAFTFRQPKKRPNYTGILKRPIVIKQELPPIPPSPGFGDGIDADAKRRYKEQSAEIEGRNLKTYFSTLFAERRKRMTALFHHYGIKPAIWKDYIDVAAAYYSLAHELADNHVPGFRVEYHFEAEKGAPVEWDFLRQCVLLFAVGELRGKGMTIKAACAELARRPRRRHEPHGWQRYSAATLERRYREAKRDEAANGFYEGTKPSLDKVDYSELFEKWRPK